MSSARWLVPAASSGAKFVDLHATVRCLRNLWSMPKTSARPSGSVPEMWASFPGPDAQLRPADWRPGPARVACPASGPP